MEMGGIEVKNGRSWKRVVWVWVEVGKAWRRVEVGGGGSGWVGMEVAQSGVVGGA